MSDDKFDLEDELAKSIANIVEEETADAEIYVRKNSKGVTPLYEDEEYDEPETSDVIETEEPADKLSKGKVALIIAIVVIVLGAVAGTVYYVVHKTLDKTKDNYAYYNNRGYDAYDSGDYEKAITNFEKALTYDEGKTNSEENIDMMIWLYDCYEHIGNEEKAITILEKVLELDTYNITAYSYLVNIYDTNEDYESIHTLYTVAEGSDDEKLLEYFQKYLAKDPVISPEETTQNDDIEVTITTTEADAKIYYSLDGEEGDFQIYTDKFELSEGETTVCYYAINKYGFESEHTEITYTISYGGPSAPRFSRDDTEITSQTKVNIAITTDNPSTDKLYYTLDGSIPTESSTLYTSYIELPQGTTTITVLVVDAHGKTNYNSRTYTVTYTDNYSQSECENIIWSRLSEKGLVDEKTHKNKDGDQCKMNYFGKKTVDGLSIQMFYYVVDGDTQDYMLGADCSSGTVYKVYSEDGSYSITKY